MSRLRFPLPLLMLCATIVPSGSHVVTRKHNMPRNGDEFAKQRIEFIDPGESGQNQIWDFSSTTNVDPDYRISYSSEGDSIIKAHEHRTTYNYRISGDTLLWTGYENRLTWAYDSIAAVAMFFPMSFGQKLERDFYFNGMYSQTKRIAMAGKSTVKADAAGTVYLPDGDTIHNVLRIKRIYDTKVKIFLHRDTSAIDVVNDSLLQHIETVHAWYAEGYRYPIVETVEHSYQSAGKEISRFRSAFITPPAEQTFGIRDDENAVVRAKQQSQPIYSNHGIPDTNPDLDTVDITLSDIGSEISITILNPPSNAEIEMILTDVAGRVFDSIPRRKSQDIYVTTIPVSSLPNGDFLIYIKIGSDTHIRKFSKK